MPAGPGIRTLSRIGFTLSLPDATGASRMVAHFIKALRSSNDDVTLIHGPVPANEASILPELHKLGVETIPEPRLARPFSPRLIGDLASLYQSRALDAVVGVQQRDRSVAMQAADRAGIPGLVSCQNTHIFWGRWPINRLKESYYAWAMRKYARLVMCSSPVVLDEIVNRYGVAADRAVLLPNAVNVQHAPKLDKESRQKLRAEFGVGDDDLLLVNVGRINIQKGQDLLLRAVSQLPLQARQFRLVFVGGVSQDAQRDKMLKYQQQLFDLVLQLGLSDRVMFVGWRTDVRSILSAADGYIHAARWEGFGIASFEAMAAELPTVWTDCWGRPDGFKDGTHGWLVPVNNVEGLTDAIRELLSRTPDERRGIGIAARQFVVDNFDVEHICDRFQRLIKEQITPT